MIFFIVLLIIALIIYYKVIRPYVLRYDTIVLFTGGNGSGKSYFSVKLVCKLYKRLRMKVFIKNIKHRIKREPLETVEIYSSIPLRMKKHFWSKPFYSYELTNEIMLGDVKIPYNSIVFIDEVNLFLSQWEFKNPNLRFVECFTSLYRHLTHGGYMVLNTQNVSKINHIFRYCANESFNLHGFRKITPFFVYTNVRRISLTEDIISVANDSLEQDEFKLWSFNNPFFKRYDTFCHDGALKTVSNVVPTKHKTLKSKQLLKIPKTKDDKSGFDERYL